MKLPTSFSLGMSKSASASSHLQERKLSRPKKGSDSPKPPDLPKPPDAAKAPDAAKSLDLPKSAEPPVNIGKDLGSLIPKPTSAPDVNPGKDAPPKKDTHPPPSAIPSAKVAEDAQSPKSKPDISPSADALKSDAGFSMTQGTTPKPTDSQTASIPNATMEASRSTPISDSQLGSITSTIQRPVSSQGASDPKDIAKSVMQLAKGLKPSQTTEMPSQTLADIHPPTMTVTMTATPTPSASPGTKKGLAPVEIVAIVLGLAVLILVPAMLFFIRKFYLMYRAERVLRKQAQTEGNELKQMNGEHVVGGTNVVDRPPRSKWGFRRKEAWER